MRAESTEVADQLHADRQNPLDSGDGPRRDSPAPLFRLPGLCSPMTESAASQAPTEMTSAAASADVASRSLRRRAQDQRHATAGCTRPKAYA
jgi:hypothetical protein